MEEFKARGMKPTNIKRTIKNKIKEWLDSLDISDDEKVMVGNDVIVSGGCITSKLIGEKVNDYDIYFRTKETTKFIANYYVNKYNSANATTSEHTKPFTPEVQEVQLLNIKNVEETRIIIYIKSAGVVSETAEEYQYFEGTDPLKALDFAKSLKKGNKEAKEAIRKAANEEAKIKLMYRPIFMTDNAITLSDDIQIVIRFFGEPAAIHENYDFVHAKCYYDYGKDVLSLPEEALKAMLSRTLYYEGSLYPLTSVYRAIKFVKRGWNISAGQLLKIMLQISDLDLTNPRILREQLLGVDVAYMYQLIEMLRNKKEQDIDTNYIMSIIDEIFD